MKTYNLRVFWLNIKMLFDSSIVTRIFIRVVYIPDGNRTHAQKRDACCHPSKWVAWREQKKEEWTALENAISLQPFYFIDNKHCAILYLSANKMSCDKYVHVHTLTHTKENIMWQ